MQYHSRRSDNGDSLAPTLPLGLLALYLMYFTAESQDTILSTLDQLSAGIIPTRPGHSAWMSMSYSRIAQFFLSFTDTKHSKMPPPRPNVTGFDPRKLAQSSGMPANDPWARAWDSSKMYFHRILLTHGSTGNNGDIQVLSQDTIDSRALCLV